MNAFRFFAVAALSLAVAAPAVAKSASRTRLWSSPNPSRAGQSVQLWAEVDGLGGGAPRGSVKFVDGDNQLGTGALSPFGAGQEVIAAGDFHSCALNDAGGVKCWGEGGSLGDGSWTSHFTPISVAGLSSGVVSIAAGAGHTCGLTIAGAAKCWGYNAYGQVGDGTTKERLAPVSVPDLASGVVAIAAGEQYSCALTRVGAVKCWGRNGSGQLGDGTTVERHAPVAVSGLPSGAVAVAAGVDHACALTGAGAVKCWGSNAYGQLGDGTTQSRLTPVAVSEGAGRFVAVTLGGEHSCALTSAGGVACWGSNRWGQLGDGTTTERHTPVAVSGLSSGVVAISAGYGYNCALTSVGAVKCWGNNIYGQLGDWTRTNRYAPVSTVGLSSGVVAITAGFAHTCTLNVVGSMRCWGYNYSGQLGIGTDAQRLTATPVSGFAGLVRARASLSTRALGVGTHSLRAGFGGDTSHTGAIGGVVQIVR